MENGLSIKNGPWFCFTLKNNKKNHYFVEITKLYYGIRIILLRFMKKNLLQKAYNGLFLYLIYRENDTKRWQQKVISALPGRNYFPR
jgi:hypothetical protein